MVAQNSNRARTGAAVSAAGMVLNLLLAAAKITAGALFGLVSVIADGFNNVGDCCCGAVSAVSFRVSEKPADKEHPYGHHRAEYVFSMVIGFLVLAFAVELGRESVEKIISGALSNVNAVIYAVLGASIAVKSSMAALFAVFSKKLDSEELRAASLDSACDCAATAAVITGALFSQYMSLPADGWAGVAVALFILWQGFKIVREAGSELLGHAPDPELLKSIKSIILSGDGVLGIHDLHVYGYGKGVYYATAHIEMDAKTDALSSHAVIDGLERRICDELNVSLTAHLDPVDLQDSEALALAEKLRESLAAVLPEAEAHDIRLIRGAKNKLVFDVGIPFSSELTDAEARKLIEEACAALGDFACAATLERE